MIVIKEEFLTEEKTRRAIKLGGWEAIGMWLAMKSYAARKNTRGFVPNDAIDDLQGAPKRARRALKALVECGLQKQAGGERGAGLVDEGPDGWTLHDYEDHSVSADEEELRREKARAKKREQRERKRRELEALRAREGGDNEWTDGGRVPGTAGGQQGDTGSACPGDPRAQARAHAGAGARPQPSPAQPNQEDPPDSYHQDLSGGGPPETRQQQSRGAIRCPPDLELDGGTVANIGMARGVSAQLVAFAVREWAIQQSAVPDRTRPLGAWMSSAARAIQAQLSDPRRRQELQAQLAEHERRPEDPEAHRRRIEAENARHIAELQAGSAPPVDRAETLRRLDALVGGRAHA